MSCPRFASCAPRSIAGNSRSTSRSTAASRWTTCMSSPKRAPTSTFRAREFSRKRTTARPSRRCAIGRLKLSEQIGDLDVEGRRDLEQRRHRGRGFGALDLRQQRHAQLGAPRHLLERQAALLAHVANVAPDGQVELVLAPQDEALFLGDSGNHLTEFIYGERLLDVR